MSARESSGASHRDRILAIFERHRATPGTAFPEERFLNHLMADPKGREAVRNSFSGLRRFNAFIDEVQLEFGVCFSMKDLEANYSLPRFEARVRELERSPRGSLASLENQVRAGPGWGVLVIVDVLLVIAAISLRGSVPLLSAIGAIACAANAGFLEFYRRGRKYQHRLSDRIRSHEASS